jgi:hypothetical protein
VETGGQIIVETGERINMQARELLTELPDSCNPNPAPGGSRERANRTPFRGRQRRSPAEKSDAGAGVRAYVCEDSDRETRYLHGG